MSKYAYDYETIIEDDYLVVDIEKGVAWADMHLGAVKKGEAYIALDVFLRDKYTLKAKEIDKIVNEVILRHHQIPILEITSFYLNIDLALSEVLRDVQHIEIFYLRPFLKRREEYRYLETLDLSTIRLHMYDARDIDFSSFKRLEICQILLDEEYCDKEQINASIEYVKDLENKMPNTKFFLECITKKGTSKTYIPDKSKEIPKRSL